MNAQHLSLSDSWMTPQDVIDRATRTLGGIDLDPASSAAGNARVVAREYYGPDRDAEGAGDGLTLPWTVTHMHRGGTFENRPASVFVNPPGGKFSKGHALGGRSKTKLFWQKLVEERAAGHIKHAIFLFFSLEGLSNCQDASTSPTEGRSPTDFLVCIPKYRLKFEPPPGVTAPGPTHANAIVYVPGTICDPYRFHAEFRPLGVIMGKFLA